MEKLAAFAVKPANNRRRVESSVVEIDEIDAPLARRRVVEEQRLRLDVQLLVGAAHLKLFKVRMLSRSLWWFEMPSYTSQVLEFLIRSGRRRTWAFQSPMRKSKSCEPSR